MATSMNKNKVYTKSKITLNKSKYGKPINVGIKNYVFIGYEHTDNIKDYIAKEYWGMLNKRLFYHINYTFRARILRNEIYEFKFKNGKSIGLFHTGLECKKNGSLLYLVFKPNPELRKQKWTLPNDPKKITEYMMTKQEVIKTYNIRSNDLPNVPDYFQKKYSFFPSWLIPLDWDSSLRVLLNHKTGGNSKQVILNEFAKNGIKLNSNIMRQELIKPLRCAVNEALNNYQTSNDYIRPGIFFLDDGYKIVHQMLLNVEYPIKSGKITKFVAVFEENKYRKEYTFTKLLNIEMAYKNARLVGKVPNSWNFNDTKTSTKKKKIKPLKPAPIKINNFRYINDWSPMVSTTDTQGLPTLSSLNDAYVSPCLSINSQTSFPSMIESKSNSLSLPQNNVNINNNNCGNNTNDCNNNNNSIGVNSTFPRTFRKSKQRVLTLISDNVVIEVLNETLIETSNNFSQPLKQARTYGYFLNNLDKVTKTQLLLSQQIKITSAHEIYQISHTNNIETVDEIRTLKNGASFHTLKTFLNVISSNGNVTTTEFSVLNNNNNNIMNSIYNININNSKTTNINNNKYNLNNSINNVNNFTSNNHNTKNNNIDANITEQKKNLVSNVN